MPKTSKATYTSVDGVLREVIPSLWVNRIDDKPCCEGHISPELAAEEFTLAATALYQAYGPKPPCYGQYPQCTEDKIAICAVDSLCRSAEVFRDVE